MKVLLFSNDGCGSCRKWKPTFERIVNDMDVPYELVDIYTEEGKPLREKYGVRGIPETIIVDDEGNELFSILGSMQEDLAREEIRRWQEKSK